MRPKQTLPIIMALYGYTDGMLILDEVMNMLVNIGHSNYTTTVLTLHGVGVDLCLYIAGFVQI